MHVNTEMLSLECGTLTYHSLVNNLDLELLLEETTEPISCSVSQGKSDNKRYTYTLQVYTVESHYNKITYSDCLSIVKNFASPSKSCILLYTFNIVNIYYI